MLVKTWLIGYVFWLLLIFTILLQIFFKIGIWYFIFETAILITCAVYVKKLLNKTFEKAEFKIDFSGYGISYFPIMMAAYLTVHFFFTIFKPPFIENIAWYILSSLLFLITLLFEALFVSEIAVFFGYLKYFENNQ